MDIVTALGWALKLFSAYFLVVSLFAFKKAGTYQEASPRTRFAVVIPARNEELVIGELVDSLFESDYPRSLYDVFVVPNNCVDDTAGEARRHGAEVIECHLPVRCKGDALKQSLAQVLDDRREYDAICVFDADNVVDSRFLSEMNNAFAAGARVAKAKNAAKNPYDSWISGCYGIYFGTFNIFFNRARAACGLSAKLVGTGFAVRREVLEKLDGWNTSTIAEDAEFATLCAMAGERVYWVPKAVAYDEEPNSFAVSMTQRKRWCSGIMQVAGLRLGEVAACFRRQPRTLLFDNMMFLCSPFVQAVSVVTLLVSYFVQAFDPVVGGLRFLIALAATMAVSYVGLTLFAIVTVCLNGQWNRRMLKSIFTFPFFMASWLPLQALALFKKTVKWEEIRHNRRMMEAVR